MAASRSLSAHCWDPLVDPSPWLWPWRQVQDPLPPTRSAQPPHPSPHPSPQHSPPHSSTQQPLHGPPLLLQLDCQHWPLQQLADSPLIGWLTPEERQQAERLRRPQDRQRHLLGRAALRRLVGCWQGQPPQRVPLRRGLHGKPFCSGGPHFNVSHSGDLILLAFHPNCPVGVDVERLRPELEWGPLAARLLCPAECRQLERLSPPAQPSAFLWAWCRLEARLKATGEGVSGLEALRRRAEQAVVAQALAERSRQDWSKEGAAPIAEPAVPGAGDASAQEALLLGGLGLRRQERLWDLRLPAGYCGALVCLQAQPNLE